MSNSKSKVYESLRKSSCSTANFRFNAHRRLNFLDKVSNLALISSSASLIVTSITIELLKNKITVPDLINIGQLCMPIVFLALSIVITNCKYGVRAEKMHECAQKLNHFGKIFEYKIAEKIENNAFSNDEFLEYKEFCVEYSKVLKVCENHDDIDRTSQKIKDSLKKCWITSPFRDVIAMGFNVSLIGYVYISINLFSLFWIWYVLNELI